MLETWGAAIWTPLTTSWLWITLAMAALLGVIAVELLTRKRTSRCAALMRALVAAAGAPAVFYGIQRTVEAPERAAQAQREQNNDALLRHVAASTGNLEAAKEVIELRARALFAPGRGMATIRRKMGRFGVTVGFHVEFEKTAYWQRDVGRKL